MQNLATHLEVERAPIQDDPLNSPFGPSDQGASVSLPFTSTLTSISLAAPLQSDTLASSLELTLVTSYLPFLMRSLPSLPVKFSVMERGCGPLDQRKGQPPPHVNWANFLRSPVKRRRLTGAISHARGC